MPSRDKEQPDCRNGCNGWPTRGGQFPVEPDRMSDYATQSSIETGIGHGDPSLATGGHLPGCGQVSQRRILPDERRRHVERAKQVGHCGRNLYLRVLQRTSETTGYDTNNVTNPDFGAAATEKTLVDVRGLEPLTSSLRTRKEI